MAGMGLNPRAGEPEEIAKVALFFVQIIRVLLMVQWLQLMRAGRHINM